MSMMHHNNPPAHLVMEAHVEDLFATISDSTDGATGARKGNP